MTAVEVMHMARPGSPGAPVTACGASGPRTFDVNRVTCDDCRRIGGEVTAAELMAAVTAVLPLAPVHVDHSGGGCATIYVGPTFSDEHDDVRYTLLIGPGHFDWHNPPASTFTFDELYVGRDDDGVADAVTVTSLGVLRDALVGSFAVLSFDEVEALGADGTGRGQ